LKVSQIKKNFKAKAYFFCYNFVGVKILKFKDFMSELDKDLKNVYLLCGEETFYIDKAREKIFAKLQVEKSDVVTFDFAEKIPLSDIVNAIDSAPLFNPQNVVLVKNANFLSAEGKSERLENVLQFMLETNFVIFIAKSADKRRKLYKIISKVGLVLDAEPLRSWQLDEWLNEKLKSIKKVMYGDARKYFLERVGILPEISLWYLENELDKISLAIKGNEIKVEHLRRLLTELPEVSNFALTDAIDAKKTKTAVQILRTGLRDKNKFPLVITVLTNHVRQLLRAKFFIKKGVKGRALGEPLELNPFIAQKVGEKSATYSTKILEEVFLELADADFKLKVGRAGIEILEKIVVKLCLR